MHAKDKIDTIIKLNDFNYMDHLYYYVEIYPCNIYLLKNFNLPLNKYRFSRLEYKNQTKSEE